MTYCTIEEVRDLTGLTDLELSDSQLEGIILDAERYVNLETGKTEGWSLSDPEYQFIQTATKFYAAALCFDTIPETAETSGKSERYRNQAKEILRLLSQESPIVVSSEYEHIEE